MTTMPQAQTVILPSENDTNNQAVARLMTLQSKALATLESILDNEEAEESVRLRASTSVLDYILKLSKLEKDSENPPLIIAQMTIGG